MSAIEIMRSIGRPIAYHPALARHVGGVNAAIFLCQLIYWDKRADNEDLGVYKTAEEWELETGLTYREQAGARKKLRDMGLLTETHQRLQHRIYYKLERAAFDSLMRSISSSESEIREPSEAFFPNDENAIGEATKEQSGDDEKRNSLISTETTAETTTEKCLPRARPGSPQFEAFWSAYPNTSRRVAKSKCAKLWKARGLDAIADDIISHVKAMATTRQWLDGYEPAPLTYLNQQRWEDGVPANPTNLGANKHGNFNQQNYYAGVAEDGSF